MPALTASALRQQLSSGQIGPLYMLVGADDVEKSAVAGEFADLVEEGLRAFNVERFYGSDAKADDVLDAVRTLPVMVPRRVVIVLEAEKLLIPKREGKAADEELARLETLVQAPPPHATVVFVCGALDGRRRLIKLLLKESLIVDCGTIENDADAALWVKTRAAREKITMEPAAVLALIERTGIDLVRLRAGLERVALYAMGHPTVTVDDVRQSVPAGPLAQENFGIANAIQEGDAAGALRQLAAALDAGAVPFFLLGQLRWAAEKTPRPRVAGAIDAVFRTDLALKSSGGDPRILLERLVVELCGETAPRKGAPYVGGKSYGYGRR
jgi:DNA polymerase-3 subunit delta